VGPELGINEKVRLKLHFIQLFDIGEW